MSETYAPGRLVPKDFQIPIENTLANSWRVQFPDYPHAGSRLIMSPEEISDWEYAGMPHEATRKNPSLKNQFGENYVMDHPNYLVGVSKGFARADDGKEHFHNEDFRESLVSGGYARDSRGLPVHPYYKTILENGALGGFGFYWNYGPNHSADAIILGAKNNQLHVVAIEKPEADVYLVPGGMIPPGEDPQKAALRELKEETKLVDDIAHAETIYTGILAGTPRQTLQSWEESVSTVFIPEDLDISNKGLRAGDDASGAFWMPVTSETLRKDHLFVSHGHYIKKAVLVFEREKGVTVAPDGRIKNNIH